MQRILTKYIIPFLLGIFLLSCHTYRNQTQDSMFNHSHKKNKHGVNEYMINGKNPPSVIMAKEAKKETPYANNPSKAAKKAKKLREKREKEADRKRRKINRKIHVRHKLYKGKDNNNNNTENKTPPTNNKSTGNAGS